MKIDFYSNRFIVQCTLVENGLVSAIPSKRYDRRKDYWIVQNLNRNCDYMLRQLKQYMTESAIQVAQETIAKNAVSYEKFPSWYKFKTIPFEHQTRAMDFAYGLRRFALFMEMGTGKTKTVIDLYSAHFMSGKIDTWIVFCPVDLKRNWEREIDIHCPLSDIPVYVIDSGKKGERAAQEAVKQDRFIAIVGIESLSVGFKKGSVYHSTLDLVINRQVAVCIDESHNCKSPDSNRSKNVLQLSQTARIMNIMTGTPTSQGFVDLYMQFEILDPNVLGFGSFYAFRSRYAVMGGYENKQIVSYQHIDELMDLIKPVTFQCTKEEALDLPPKTYMVLEVEMSAEQKKAYRQIDEDMRTVINEDVEVTVEHMMTKFGALQQISGGFLNFDNDFEEREAKILIDPTKNPKIREIVKLTEEHPEKSIIVWAKYRAEIEMIKQALEPLGGVSEYHGGIEDRMEQVDAFNNGTNRFFVSNQQTGGTGLNLVVSDLVIYYSNSFRLVDRMQSEDRCHRIGQKSKKVTYVDLWCRDTKDEHIHCAISNKQDLAAYLRDKLASGTLSEIE